jgi:hypothetical protein
LTDDSNSKLSKRKTELEKGKDRSVDVEDKSKVPGSRKHHVSEEADFSDSDSDTSIDEEVQEKRQETSILTSYKMAFFLMI